MHPPVKHLLAVEDHFFPSPHTQTAVPLEDWQVEPEGHVFW